MSSEAEVCKPYARPAVLADCQALAVAIREEDRKEIWHGYRVSPIEAFLIGFENSDKPYTAVWQDRPIFMFGVSGIKGDTGVPWLLGTDDIKRVRKSFLRHCRTYLEEMHSDYPLLVNQVWAKNTVHIQWLMWLGFEFDEPQHFGPDNELFIRFHKASNG
jgi:hypothetical protein